jgi:hypothetical protein
MRLKLTARGTVPVLSARLAREGSRRLYATTRSAEAFAAGRADDERLEELAARNPSWLLVYGVESSPYEQITARLATVLPEVPVFGATSFRGVFTAGGFTRDVAVLAGDRDDVRATAALKHASAETAEAESAAACREIEARAGERPSTLLLHATPGFEERVLAGVRSVWGRDVPVYGGSAADDHLEGKWRVFSGSETSREGFLLVGFGGAEKPLGGFLGGYLPTRHVGRVTSAEGRVVRESGGRPAAVVYDAWTGGAVCVGRGGGGGGVG